ncbi:uncharacterized protein EV420DRAFT_1480522 [Desarmillaria tabescens]|uniref:F-box domain-containing protein n=1 Tax=Armillaria tabescens TaxID=1929756 RepID=A0AA39KA85_ARMTA|nr:uncharacterized protein EV420DRAFT_1480522 [Desarmillaria tabescens]KAK0457447.1 hypothetical protein EV420DRAFT_1480522 [Desarmillaria tabescens]
MSAGSATSSRSKLTPPDLIQRSMITTDADVYITFRKTLDLRGEANLHTQKTSHLHQLVEFDGGAIPSSVPSLELGSGSLLSQEEIRRLIQENIDALEEEAINIGQDIDFFQSLISRFRRRVDQNRDIISFQKCLLVPLPPPSVKEITFLADTAPPRVPYASAPISILPVEIIARILQIATEVASRKSSYDIFNVKKSAPWTFSLVCRAWRTIVSSTPALWCRIDILGDEYSDHFPKAKRRLLRKYLQRSSQHPLDITMDISVMDNFERPLKSLTHHTHHWGILDLTITPHRFRSMASSIGVASFPVLKRLFLYVQDARLVNMWAAPLPELRDGRLDDLTPPIELFRDAYQLEEVILQGAGLSEVLLPLRQLRVFNGDIDRPSEVSCLFRGAHDLYQATLRVRFENWDEQLEPALHKKLHWLLLHTNTECLKHLRLPALEHLQVEKNHYTPWRDTHVLDTDEFLLNSQCQLRTLFLEVPALPFDHLVSILERCSPTLTALSLSFSCLVPHVKHLSIRDDFYVQGIHPHYATAPGTHNDELVDVVASRRNSEANPNEVALLKSLTLCLKDWR